MVVLEVYFVICLFYCVIYCLVECGRYVRSAVALDVYDLFIFSVGLLWRYTRSAGVFPRCIEPFHGRVLGRVELAFLRLLRAVAQVVRRNRELHFGHVVEGVLEALVVDAVGVHEALAQNDADRGAVEFGRFGCDERLRLEVGPRREELEAVGVLHRALHLVFLLGDRARLESEREALEVLADDGRDEEGVDLRSRRWVLSHMAGFGLLVFVGWLVWVFESLCARPIRRRCPPLPEGCR